MSVDGSDSTFEELGVADWLVNTCASVEILKPTPIQTEALPTLISGSNGIIHSPTGSGKTLCFALPTVQKLAEDPYGVFCVVLTPVRELAQQIQQQFITLGQHINLRTCLMVGGKSTGHQCNVIMSGKPHVVIATPGRLADAMRASPDMLAPFARVKVLVLDEADRLLQGSGFSKDLMDIIGLLPSKDKRQTILVSATLSREVTDIQSKYGVGNMPLFSDPESINGNVVPSTITNLYIEVPQVARMTYLHHLLRNMYPTERIIIFARTIISCQTIATSIERFLADMPENQGKVACLHSMLEGQSRRFAALGKFRNQHARILVATDVASRGLDIPKVNVVINYELPTDVAHYVHRVGRCGRNNMLGKAISLVSEEETKLQKAIQDEVSVDMQLLACNDDVVLKLLPATSAARRKAEAILQEVGFEEKVKQRGIKRHKITYNE